MRPFLLAAFLLSVAAPLSAKEPMPAPQLDRFAQDLHDKNIADTLTLFTPDAIFVEPDGSTHYGKAQIRSLYQHVTRTYDSDLDFHLGSIDQDGDVALGRVAWTETLHNRVTGKTAHLHGGCLIIIRQQPNGKWLFQRMEWTLDPNP